MLNQFLKRWIRPYLAPRSRAPFSPHLTSINPPALRHSDSFMQTLLRWIPGESDAWGAGDGAWTLGKRRGLKDVQSEFEAALEDIHSDDIEDLLKRIRSCRSLRDLWHLRAAVFNVMARAHTQSEAEQRMAQLNQRFPGNSPSAPRLHLAEQQAAKSWH